MPPLMIDLFVYSIHKLSESTENRNYPAAFKGTVGTKWH